MLLSPKEGMRSSFPTLLQRDRAYRHHNQKATTNSKSRTKRKRARIGRGPSFVFFFHLLDFLRSQRQGIPLMCDAMQAFFRLEP
ncbi:hypothetical protein BHM03_00042082 [Ensete ventricosum]|nr:hypothetical protein BHM03_00042082 [Ensete ventricosum]